MGGEESKPAAEEEEPAAKAPPPGVECGPPHPALRELERHGYTGGVLRSSTGALSVSLTCSGGVEIEPHDGLLSPVDRCVLSLAKPVVAPPPGSAPAAPPEPEPEPEPEPQPGAPSDPEELRVWLQSQMAAGGGEGGGGDGAAPAPAPAAADAVPEWTAHWQRLYDSHRAGTALQTFGRSISGYVGPSLLVLQIRPKAGVGAPACPTGLVGAYLDTPWRSGDKFFGGTGSLLFSMAEREPAASSTGSKEHCRFFPAKSHDPKAPGNVAFLCTEPRRGGPARGAGFGGKKDACRLWLEGDLCRGRISLDTRACDTYATGNLLWWCPNADTGAGLSRDFEILRIEAWGCGDETALRKRDATRQHKDAQAERARKVDVRNFVDAETGRLDSQTASMLSGGEYGAKNAADLSRQALQSDR